MRSVRNVTGRAVRTAGLLASAAALAFAGGVAGAGAAVADSPSPSASPSDGGDAAKGPTEAGTSFRTATPFALDQRATASASTGDYLYWVLPVDAGQQVTVKAKVTLPESARHGAATWQLDVYDGLRRRQACRYGVQTRAAAQDAATVELSCALRTVRGWAEQWSNDPLPGDYYVRLTAVGVPAEDLGQPVQAEVQASANDAGGAQAVDGKLSAPLVPGAGSPTPEPQPSASAEQQAADGAPDGGWSAGWWSDRWVWTAVGGVLAALAGIGGYRLTRGSGRPAHLPPGV
ncbi:hypothetical protein ACFU90_19460 [Streptomyces noursei]|uniref:Peptidase n=1 Tax=Streptomyces noursei TaxID=1971 RepID=A0A401RDC6_STRNR|nr:hypothetical protein [Streptomyces noursei]EXU89813.1 hypothetical protein P354_19570 [Streptomyces noursei PD-1]UWS76246.1 hypothetical protein N1H47_36385 [Streptomyces noursei]GCB95633.1 hypothetical protein SALB_08440 [Streptomyces noursei]